jgi:O-antigen ligase
LPDTLSVSRARVFGRHLPRHGESLGPLMAQVCIITLIFLSVTAPPIRFSENFPYLKAEQALLPFIVAGYAWLFLIGLTRMIRFNGLFVIGTLYSFCVILSIWYGSTILRHTPVLLRDFYEVPKLLLPVAFFTLAYEAELSEASLRRLLDFFALAILLVCLYAWGQFAGLGITFPLNSYYSAGEHVDLSLRYLGRVYSTMGNPNVLGQLMGFAIATFTMAALFHVGNGVRNIAVVVACLATLAMTASRYGLLTSSLGIALIFAFPSTSGRRRAARLGLLILLLPVFALAFNRVAITHETTTQRLESLKNPLQTDSVRDRLDNLWRDAFSDFARSPWIGNGSAKVYFSGIITDSEYLDVLKEFGIVGFLPYMAYYIFPLFLLWKGLKAGQRAGPLLEELEPATFLTLRVSFVMILLAMVMNIGESTFYNQLLQGFLWMWMGLGTRCAYSIIDASRQLSFP